MTNPTGFKKPVGFTLWLRCDRRTAVRLYDIDYGYISFFLNLRLNLYLFFSHSNKRCASSYLNNCVPSFIVAADPQATPQRITSFRFLF